MGGEWLRPSGGWVEGGRERVMDWVQIEKPQANTEQVVTVASPQSTLFSILNLLFFIFYF